jgi:hypothetical protein
MFSITAGRAGRAGGAVAQESSMRRLCLLAATALTALSLAAAARAEQPFNFDLAPGKLPKTVVPEAYQIDIVPDLQKLSAHRP